MKMFVVNKTADSSKTQNSNFGTASGSASNSIVSLAKAPSWWPFRFDPKSCSSSSAKGIGSGVMKKEDIQL